jgi:superoxide dismutase, Cu-Zn family
MPRHFLAGSAIAVLMLGTAAIAQESGFESEFIDTSGKSVGTARLTQTANGVLAAVDITGLPPGEHGFHLHETGACNPQDGFESAGDHYAPRDHEHGYMAAEGFHAGDLPNQFVGEDGRLRAHAILNDVSLDGGEAPLLDEDGSALVVHTAADDYRSQPSGESGDRLVCAVVKRDS